MTEQIDDLENILEKLDKCIFEMVDIRERLAKHYHGGKTWNYGDSQLRPNVFWA